MKMKILDREQTQAPTRTSNGPHKALLMFLVPLLAIGSILCIVFGISNLIEVPNGISVFLCVVCAPAQVVLLAFLIASKISGSYTDAFKVAFACMCAFVILITVIGSVVNVQQENQTENTREELMREQGYENLENRGKSTYYAEKDGKEYLLIVDKMKDDGEMKFEVTPFEKGTKEALN